MMHGQTKIKFSLNCHKTGVGHVSVIDVLNTSLRQNKLSS